MKSRGELEAAICEGVGHFEQDYMGRGPENIHTHLLGDFLVVRLQGVLTAACVLPAYSLFSIQALPAALAGTTLSLTLLLTPAWSDDPRAALESRMQQAGRCFFLALWLASALAFFLLIATRVVPFACRKSS